MTELSKRTRVDRSIRPDWVKEATMSGKHTLYEQIGSANVTLSKSGSQVVVDCENGDVAEQVLKSLEVYCDEYCLIAAAPRQHEALLEVKAYFTEEVGIREKGESEVYDSVLAAIEAAEGE